MDTSERHINSRGSMPAIKLAQMPQQIEVRDPEDDWTGLNNPKERRRLQNRLNQRLWRKRQRVKNAKPKAEKLPSQKTPHPSIQGSEDITPPLGEESRDREIRDTDGEYEMANDEVDISDPPQLSSSLCKMTPAAIEEMMSRFEKWAHQSYLLGSPRVDLLLTLIQFNVFRALISNNFSLGFDLAWLNEDAISPFNTSPPEKFDSPLPANLRPTELQHKVLHHPWIDLFPIPGMRDNFLLAGADYDDTEICMDIVEICNKPNERVGLIVWGEPWDINGWEASPEFLKKWAWVVEGCHELFKSTNYWRMKRGEKPIAF